MRTKAAVLWELGGKWEVEEVELDPPKAGEVLLKLTASGMCHSDYHLVTGDIPVGLPYVGGHEGAGVVGSAVSSATGLGVLLMATLFPVMVNVGISRGAAAAICASPAAIILSPTSIPQPI